MKKVILMGIVFLSLTGCTVTARKNRIQAPNVVKACMGCHGANFEKRALGKSKIVKNMSRANIITALKGYKNGSYGGTMKSLMFGQVQRLKNKDMDDIANYIISL